MESQIRTIGLLITFVAIIYALRRGRDMPALVFLALAPLVYFAQNVFIVLSPAKLMGLILLGVVVLKPRYISLFRNKYLGAFLPYYFYLFVLTFFMPIFWPEHSATEQGFLYSNTMRGYVQIFQMFMGLAIIAVIVDSLSSVNSLLRAQVTLLVTMALICVYGIYVWFAQRLGLPFNPINRQGKGDELREITSLIDGSYRARAYSLTGEPKTLAANACTGFILTYFTPANRVGFLKGLKGEVLLVSLFLVTLVLTLSTAGYLILPIMIITALAIQVRVGGVVKGVIVRFIAITIILTPVMYFSGYDVAGSLSTIMESRVEARLDDDRGMFTYAETAIVKFWEDEPYFAITGVGLGGSAFYVREYDSLSYSGYIAAPRGIFGFVSDRGIIGLLLFLIPLVKASRALIAVAASNSPNKRIYAGILIICAISVVLMFTKGQWHDEWLVVGLICAGAAVANRERRAMRADRASPQISSRARCSVR